MAAAVPLLWCCLLGLTGGRGSRVVQELDPACLPPLRQAYCHSLNALLRREVSPAPLPTSVRSPGRSPPVAPLSSA